MESAIIVRGKMADSRHIELSEAVPGLTGDVEVVLRRVARAPEEPRPDVFELIASLGAGTRSKGGDRRADRRRARVLGRSVILLYLDTSVIIEAPS